MFANQRGNKWFNEFPGGGFLAGSHLGISRNVQIYFPVQTEDAFISRFKDGVFSMKLCAQVDETHEPAVWPHGEATYLCGQHMSPKNKFVRA